MKKTNTAGFSHLEVILLIVFVFIIGFIGLYIQKVEKTSDYKAHASTWTPIGTKTVAYNHGNSSTAISVYACATENSNYTYTVHVTASSSTPLPYNDGISTRMSLTAHTLYSNFYLPTPSPSSSWYAHTYQEYSATTYPTTDPSAYTLSYYATTSTKQGGGTISFSTPLNGISCTQDHGSFEPSSSTSLPAPSVYNAALSDAVRADLGKSVTLPDGQILWTFGDTFSVNGSSTAAGSNTPHDSLFIQSPGSYVLKPLAGITADGNWQQVPNFKTTSGVDFFWFAAPVVQGNNLYIIGQMMTGTGAAPKVVGNDIAEFSIDNNSITYKGIEPISIPGYGDSIAWDSILSTGSGWWVGGTSSGQKKCFKDCFTGDEAYVPFGDLTTTTDWQVHPGVVASSNNIDSQYEIVPANSIKGYYLFTKEGGELGQDYIERLYSTSILGPWGDSKTWAIPVPSDGLAYNVGLHPEQINQNGEMLVSYSINGRSKNSFDATEQIYYPHFIYLPY